MSTLPNELIENILEHVYGDYPSPIRPFDLYRCSLVCRTWRALAQPLILSQLFINPQGERINGLQENQHLLRYVRQAWVHYLPTQSLSHTQGILYSLPNLRELYLLGCGSEPLFREMDQPKSNELLQNLTLLGLSEIADFPIKYFYQCSSLRHLKIRSSTFDFEHEPTSSDAPRPQLHSLHILSYEDVDVQILEWMLRPQSAFDLTKLTLFRAVDQTNEVEPYEWTGEIVKLCASTLQDLMLDPPTIYGISNPQITPKTLLYPSTLFNLRTVSIAIIQEMGDYTNYIPWLNAFFTMLPPNNRLEEVRIPCMFVDLPKSGEESSIEDHLGLYGWSDLDLTLSYFPSLKQVVIGVHEMSRRDRADQVAVLLRKVFPRLDSKGIFEIVNATFSKDFGYFSNGDHWWEVKS